MKYKYTCAHEWLVGRILNAGEEERYQMCLKMASKLDPDTIQDLFQEKMAKDGYFETRPEGPGDFYACPVVIGGDLSVIVHPAEQFDLRDDEDPLDRLNNYDWDEAWDEALPETLPPVDESESTCDRKPPSGFTTIEEIAAYLRRNGFRQSAVFNAAAMAFAAVINRYLNDGTKED